MMRTADRATASPAARSPSSGSPNSRLFRFILFASALVLTGSGAVAAELHGRVVGVTDGDTITVLDETRANRKVRLAGIDAPEKNQPYGAEATQHLAALANGKPVAVTWRKRDRYGRLIGLVRLAVPDACGKPQCPGMEDIGLAQIESGLAWHYTQYQNEQTIEDRRRYALAEQIARAKREGLWNDALPVAPWDYRSSRRAATAMLDVQY